MPSEIINVHAHMHKNQDLAARVKLWEECGLVKVCVHVLGLEGKENTFIKEDTFTNKEFIPIMKEYRDIILGFARIDLGWEPDEPDVVDAYKEQGFTGLKFIRCSHNYDDAIYYPLYERAQALSMPVLFHTGFLAIGTDDSELGISTEKMRAMRLDTIGRAFPDLRIMCGHIGQPHYNEGLNVITEFANIWGEYSGGGGSPRKETGLRHVLLPLPGADMTNPDENRALQWYTKLCFSTDSPEPPKYIEMNKRLLAELEVPEELQEKFYWQNAAEWLNIKI